MQTPFSDAGALDIVSLQRQVEFAVSAGCRTAAYPGFVSEWWKLSPEEIEEAARVIVNTAKGSARIVLNITAQSTYLAVQQAREFANLGADALMCLPPFIAGVSSQGVMDHLESVLDAVRLPHILQYSPSLTGTRIEPSALVQLQERYPWLTAVKVDFVPPGPAITELNRTVPAGAFTWLVGYAGVQLQDAVARGAHGLMGGTGHVREDLAVWASLQRDPEEQGARDFAALLPLLNSEMQTIQQSIATHKWLLREQGIISSDHIRTPGAGLDEWQIQELKANWKRARAALGL